MLAIPTVASAAEPLVFSLAQGGAGPLAQLNSGNPSLYAINTDRGFDRNATASADFVGFGYGQASAAPGAGDLGLPQVRASAVGAPDAFNFGYAQAYQAYTWNGASGIDLNVSTFIGRLDYTAGGAPGSSFVRASLAIIDGSLRGSQAIQDAWGTVGQFGSFNATCGTPGAIGLGTTGTLTSLGPVSTLVSPTCGVGTFHLEPGQEFFVQSRLFAGHFGGGYTDASHTFSVEISPDAPIEIQEALARNLSQSPGSLAPVPEPATWALMIGGFGLAGAMLRRRRAVAA